jgi:transcriptional regulator with XRE-family HTH domain
VVDAIGRSPYNGIVIGEPALEALYKELGHRIRQARLDAGLTPQALGQLVGLSRPSIVNLEAGRQHAPIHTLWRVADAVGIPASQLLPDVIRATAPGTVVTRKLRQEQRMRAVSPQARKSIRRFLEDQLGGGLPSAGTQEEEG